LIDPIRVFALAAMLGALGMWMMLPRGSNGGRWTGGLLIAGALGLGASQAPWLGSWVADGFWFFLAGVTILAAIATVAPRSPARCAVGFGLALIGAGGLFIFGGVQIPAAIAVAVFGGAILPACLIVLRRVQLSGDTIYDQTSWEPLISAATGVVIIMILAITVCGVTARLLGAGGSTIVGQRAEFVLLNNYLTVGAVLFGAGLIGLLSRRNMVVMLLSAELMLFGVLLSLVAFWQLHGDFGGRVFVLLAVALAVCEATIGLALIWMLHGRNDQLDVAARQSLQPPRSGPIQFYALAMVIGLLVLMIVSTL